MNQENNNINNQNIVQDSQPEEVIPTSINNQNGEVFNPTITPVEETVPTQNNTTSNQQEVAPSTEDKKVIINTKKNKTSNFFLFFIIIIIVVFLLNIDTVVKYFNDNMTPEVSNEEEDFSSYNLVDGFIKIDENNSNMKTQKIKFYNFSKKENDTIVYNYVSDIRYDKTEDLEIYIEVYNSNKELLYKEMFTKENIEIDSINSTEMKLPSDIYQKAYYILVKKYTTKDLNNKITLTCNYPIESNDVNGNYNIVYTFTNNELSSYEVTKELNILNTEKENKYMIELQKEKEELTNNSLENDYTETPNVETNQLNIKLNYTIDLLIENNNYKTLYDKGMYLVNIKEKEIQKKWNCENG